MTVLQLEPKHRRRERFNDRRGHRDKSLVRTSGNVRIWSWSLWYISHLMVFNTHSAEVRAGRNIANLCGNSARVRDEQERMPEHYTISATRRQVLRPRFCSHARTSDSFIPR